MLVGEHLVAMESTAATTATTATTATSSSIITSLLASEVALQVQRSLAKFARTIDADALALDTLKSAVEYFRQHEEERLNSGASSSLVAQLQLLRQVRTLLLNGETVEGGDVDTSLDACLDRVKLWEL